MPSLPTIKRTPGRAALAWVGVCLFWLVATRNAHPTLALALIVTTSLVGAYALAAWINGQVFIPRLWDRRRFGRYMAALAGTMVGLTGMALAVIRLAYLRLWGPDADPLGFFKHFGIDLFGMAVHLIAARALARLAGNPRPRPLAPSLGPTDRGRFSPSGATAPSRTDHPS